MKRIGMTLNQKFYVGSMDNLMRVLRKDVEDGLKKSITYDPFISFVNKINDEDCHEAEVIDVDFLFSAMLGEPNG